MNWKAYLNHFRKIEFLIAKFALKQALPGCYFSTDQKSNYDLIVIGGGSGGLACAKEAGDLGKNVAVLDFVTPSPQGTRWDIGGTCVNVGCIPKKLMHYASLMHHSFKNAKAYGWQINSIPAHDWSSLSHSVQMYIRSLNWGHKVQLNDRNITYINGKGSFIDKNIVQAVNKKGQKILLHGKNIVIAVGGRPRYPQILGSKLCISSDDIFWRHKAPGKTLVIGGSYVGLECAGFLCGLGFDTSLMIRSIPLRGFDQQIARLITAHMSEEGVNIYWSYVPKEIRETSEGKLEVLSENIDKTKEMTKIYDTVLLAIGRDPVTKVLDLEKAGVICDSSNKVVVDDSDMTSVENIYAIGDVAKGRPELTPVAVKAGKLLARRLFDGSNQLMNYINVPTTVFTPLEYGCIGLSEEDAKSMYGDNLEVYHAYYKPLEYTLPEQNHKQCYIKLLCTNVDSPILGMHFLGPNAGEVTQGFAVAMSCGFSYNQLTNTVGIHPTSAEEIVKLHITKRSGKDPTVTGC